MRSSTNRLIPDGIDLIHFIIVGALAARAYQVSVFIYLKANMNKLMTFLVYIESMEELQPEIYLLEGVTRTWERLHYHKAE